MTPHTISQRPGAQSLPDFGPDPKLYAMPHQSSCQCKHRCNLDMAPAQIRSEKSVVVRRTDGTCWVLLQGSMQSGCSAAAHNLPNGSHCHEKLLKMSNRSLKTSSLGGVEARHFLTYVFWSHVQSFELFAVRERLTQSAPAAVRFLVSCLGLLC